MCLWLFLILQHSEAPQEAAAANNPGSQSDDKHLQEFIQASTIEHNYSLGFYVSNTALQG